MMDFTRELSLASMARYTYWKLTKSRDPVALQLRNKLKFIIRHDTSSNADYGVAYEVFIHKDYEIPASIDPGKVRLVVDIGGNVGFSTLHWLHVFPNCRVEVFEPHPLHVKQIHENLAHAGVSGRVTVHPRAAGASTRGVSLSRAGASSSTLVAADDPCAVEMVDIFELLRGKTIDVLKIDAEGGEYEILGDDRLGELQIDHLVMEWHRRGVAEDDRTWCEQRLIQMGFIVQPLAERPTPNMLWASRTGAPGASVSRAGDVTW